MGGQRSVRAIFIRHGESTENGCDKSGRPHIFQHPAAGLSELGKNQAQRIAGHLIADFFKKHHEGGGEIKIMSSDLARARQTSYILANGLNDEGLRVKGIRFDPRLRERDAGPNLYGRLIPPELNEREINILVASEGGEPMSRVLGSVKGWAVGLQLGAREYEGSTLLIVTHESPLRILAGLACELKIDEAFQNFKFDNGSISPAEVSGGSFTFEFMNYTGHLQPEGTYAQTRKEPDRYIDWRVLSETSCGQY